MTATKAAPSRMRPAARLLAIWSALGGRFGWRFWWQLVIWLVDALTVATFRRGEVTEPAALLILGSLAAVSLLWFWGARFAVALGHPRRIVHAVTAVTSVLLCLAGQTIGALARMAEVAVVGNDNAYIFIARIGVEDDHSQFFGGTESFYLLYGLPLIGLTILVACWVLGWGWAGGLLAVLVGVGGVVAVMFAWVPLSSIAGGKYHYESGVALAALLVAGCIVGGWFGFRRVAIA